MHRIRAIISIGVILGLMGSSINAEAFTDTKGKWYEGTVNEMRDKGVVRGYSNVVFGGEASVTGDEVFAFILRGMGEEINEEGEKWYREVRDLAKVKGFGQDTEGLTEVRSRQWVLEQIGRAIGLEGEEVAEVTFKDSSGGIADVLYGEGILKGVEREGVLYVEGDRDITRAETVVIVKRMMEWLERRAPKEDAKEAMEGQGVENANELEEIDELEEIEETPEEETTIYSRVKSYGYKKIEWGQEGQEGQLGVRGVYETLKKMGESGEYIYTVRYSKQGYEKEKHVEDVVRALRQVMSIYPEKFSHISEYRYSYVEQGDQVVYTYILGSKEKNRVELRKTQEAYIENVRATLIAKLDAGKITSSMSQKEQARVVYDWLLANTEYDYGLSPESFTGYGQYNTGKAVCQGYVATYNMMLKMLGIEVQGVVGRTNSSDRDYAHIWVKKVLDGEVVYSDPTWGSTQGDGDRYFNISEYELQRNYISQVERLLSVEEEKTSQLLPRQATVVYT